MLNRANFSLSLYLSILVSCQDVFHIKICIRNVSYFACFELLFCVEVSGSMDCSCIVLHVGSLNPVMHYI